MDAVKPRSRSLATGKHHAPAHPPGWPRSGLVAPAEELRADRRSVTRDRDRALLDTTGGAIELWRNELKQPRSQRAGRRLSPSRSTEPVGGAVEQRQFMMGVTGTVVLTGATGRKRKEEPSVPLWGRHETEGVNPHRYPNPFRDVALNAVFTRPGGGEVRHLGYYAGDGHGGRKAASGSCGSCRTNRESGATPALSPMGRRGRTAPSGASATGRSRGRSGFWVEGSGRANASKSVAGWSSGPHPRPLPRNQGRGDWTR
jgi:hypothetical protein